MRFSDKHVLLLNLLLLLLLRLRLMGRELRLARRRVIQIILGNALRRGRQLVHRALRRLHRRLGADGARVPLNVGIRRRRRHRADAPPRRGHGAGRRTGSQRDGGRDIGSVCVQRRGAPGPL